MRVRVILVFTFLVVSALGAGAATYKTLHNFLYDDLHNSGISPYAGLVFDRNGHLYGVTAYDGGDYQDGSVFELMPSAQGWSFGVRYWFFDDSPLGRVPMGGLALDEAGNMYGTNSFSDDDTECGTVFALSRPDWDNPLHQFAGADGCIPMANLTYSKGWLWGTTAQGGASDQGTVFAITTSGDQFYSYSFQGSNGAKPLGGVNVQGYGAASSGGQEGLGTIYWLDPNNGPVSIYSFQKDGRAGYAPVGDLLMSFAGDVRVIYGTTSAGGKFGAGAVYRLTEVRRAPGQWRIGVVHSFSGRRGGRSPLAGLSADAAGNLYGTTSEGGDWDCGTVFKLSSRPNNSWRYTVLYSFNPENEDNGGDGCYPTSGVTVDAAGNLYGTTLLGGWEGGGVVYEIVP